MTTHDQKLQLNPDVRLIHRKGVLFAGQMSGVKQPVQLLEFDIIVLYSFLIPRSAAEAAADILDGPNRGLLAETPAPPALMSRIESLRQAGILGAAKAGENARASDDAIGLADCPAAQVDADLRLRLGANISPRPARGTLEVWSPLKRQYFCPGPGLLLLMYSFLTDVRAGEVIALKSPLLDPGHCSGGIQWLIDAGLLIRSNEKPSMPERLTRTESRQIASRSGPATGIRWQELQPDGRIPVYFTPHMENHYPLALGMISAAISEHKQGELLARFQLLPITYLTPRELFSEQYGKFGPGVWLFSNYMWSLDINQKISSTVKDMGCENLTIHGGPSTPGYAQACADFMRANPSVDIAVHGEGEVAVAELLECVYRNGDGSIRYDTSALSQVQGLTYRDQLGDGGLRNTATRNRVRDLDSIPSPYLTGVFDSYGDTVEAAIIESNRGCPFGCTFCDWGSATRQKVRKFDLDRVKGEIDWIGRNRVRVIWIADANFGMYDRDIELSKFIVETKKKYGFPLEVVVNYTKNTTRRLVEIIKAFSAGGIISQGIISIQTTDETTLKVINRQNIKTEKYDELADVFAEANLPLSTDLMIGLPGITPEAFDRDLQRYFDVDVSAKAYPTQLLPNSPMADPDYMEKYQIRVDDEGFVISCYSFTEADLADMKAIFNLFMIADGYSVLRYVLRYLQWEKDIPALSFLHGLQDEIRDDPSRYPAVSWVAKYFANDKFMPGGWKAFFDQVAEFAGSRYGVERDSAFETVLLANEMAMPDNTIDYPVTVHLEHDFVQWFRDNNSRDGEGKAALSEYPAGTFRVDDPDLLASIDMDYMQYDSHQYFWELSSATARAKSVSDVRHLSTAGS